MEVITGVLKIIAQFFVLESVCEWCQEAEVVEMRELEECFS